MSVCLTRRESAISARVLSLSSSSFTMGLLFGLILSLLPSDEGHLSLHIYKSLPPQSTLCSPSSSLGLTGRGNCEGVCGGGGGGDMEYNISEF